MGNTPCYHTRRTDKETTSTMRNSTTAHTYRIPAILTIIAIAAILAVASVMTTGLTASAEEPEASCPDGGYNPTPTAVAVNTVPISVASTVDDYFVLHVTHDVDGTDVALPVLIKKGETGTTALAENVEALPAERYRVEKYLIDDPADIDGDCTDDITELDSLGSMNPLNPAAAIANSDGTLAIPEQATFDALARTIRGKNHIKFTLFGMDADHPSIYFQNTGTHARHREFLDAIGFDQSTPAIMGELQYDQDLTDTNGNQGVFYYALSPESHSYDQAVRTHLLLSSSIPIIDDNLAWHILNFQLPAIQPDLKTLQESRMDLLFDDDIYTTTFTPLNPGEGYGLLRSLEPDDRPNPRDVVIYETLPNELPPVSGIISTVPQTQLSHVNLRAIQNGIPNAFISYAMEDSQIPGLIGKYVRFEVTSGWDIRAATKAEVDAHYESSRPAGASVPQRDLSITEITPLNEIEFDDWDSFGVKATNVAVLRTLGFTEGTIPDGFAIPFYFYDEFMKHNDFYTRIETMLADTDFQADFDEQAKQLKALRKDIENGDTPQWILTALADMNTKFPPGDHQPQVPFQHQQRGPARVQRGGSVRLQITEAR